LARVRGPGVGGVENFRVPPIIWQLVGSYSLNMATLDFLTLIIWRLVLIFFLAPKKHCYLGILASPDIRYPDIPDKTQIARIEHSLLLLRILFCTAPFPLSGWKEDEVEVSVNYDGRLASALSPPVAAVWDPRTQPQHAQLLQG